MTRCKHDLIDGTCADCLRIPGDVMPEPLEDWWMGKTDTSSGWRSADVVIKAMNRVDERLWTPELVGIEDMMSDDDRVGGIAGLDIETYRTVDAGLIKLGQAEPNQ